jgi:hypothetical protein
MQVGPNHIGQRCVGFKACPWDGCNRAPAGVDPFLRKLTNGKIGLEGPYCLIIGNGFPRRRCLRDRLCSRLQDGRPPCRTRCNILSNDSAKCSANGCSDTCGPARCRSSHFLRPTRRRRSTLSRLRQTAEIAASMSRCGGKSVVIVRSHPSRKATLQAPQSLFVNPQ